MKDPVNDPTSIGNLLRSHGVTDEDLKKAIDTMQDQKDLLLGETLVKLEIISEDVLDEALARQQVLRSNGTNGSKHVSKLLDHAIKKIVERGNKRSEIGASAEMTMNKIDG